MEKNHDWKYPNPFVFELSAQSSDLDNYGHVNNVVYVRWLDECARAHSKAAGIDVEQAHIIGLGMVVRENRISYLSPAFSGDRLLIGEWLTFNDNKLRATREFQIIRRSDSTLLVEAETDYICINLKTGRPAKMPSQFRAAYKPFELINA